MSPPILLGYHPRAWQRACHLNKERFTVLALHRRAGKTELAIMELLDQAMRTTLDLALFVYVAPFLKQAKAIAWARLKKKLLPLLVMNAVVINESELTVTFGHNGAVLRIVGADNPDALRGVRLDYVVLDEVAQIKPEVWNDILQPALSDRKGGALFIGTPSGINLFSELFYRAESLHDWHSARYTVYDTVAIDPDEVARLKRDMSETSFAREYLCDFSAQGDDQLISLSDAEAASLREYSAADTALAPLVIGVDPARFGDDRSVIFPRRGLTALTPSIYHGINNMELAGRVAAHIETHRPEAVFIDAGAGAGVIDRVRQLGHAVVEVPFGGRANAPEQFVNRRTEMWWLMREWISQGGAIPKDSLLKQELSTPQYWYDSAGRAVLESKDEIKKRLHGGRSPDLADALALTFAMPVHPRELVSTARRPTAEYDPYTIQRDSP